MTTSPPFLTHSIIDLSRLAYWVSGSLFAESGGMVSLMRRQVTGSPGTGGALVEGGSGHSLHGFPGQRHPAHSACATAVDMLITNARTSWTTGRKIPLSMESNFITFTVLSYHRESCALSPFDARRHASSYSNFMTFSGG